MEVGDIGGRQYSNMVLNRLEKYPSESEAQLLKKMNHEGALYKEFFRKEYHANPLLYRQLPALKLTSGQVVRFGDLLEGYQELGTRIEEFLQTQFKEEDLNPQSVICLSDGIPTLLLEPTLMSILGEEARIVSLEGDSLQQAICRGISLLQEERIQLETGYPVEIGFNVNTYSVKSRSVVKQLCSCVKEGESFEIGENRWIPVSVRMADENPEIEVVVTENGKEKTIMKNVPLENHGLKLGGVYQLGIKLMIPNESEIQFRDQENQPSASIPFKI